MAKYAVFVTFCYDREYIVEAEGPMEATEIVEDRVFEDIRCGSGSLDVAYVMAIGFDSGKTVEVHVDVEEVTE